MLQEDEDFLHEIVIAMEPEDGVISVYGEGEEYTPAFTGRLRSRNTIRIADSPRRAGALSGVLRPMRR